MNDKQPYTAPQIVRVELNMEQAVLAACSTLTNNPFSTTPATQGCFPPSGGAPTGCKRFNFSSGFNSGARAS